MKLNKIILMCVVNLLSLIHNVLNVLYDFLWRKWLLVQRLKINNCLLKLNFSTAECVVVEVCKSIIIFIMFY